MSSVTLVSILVLVIGIAGIFVYTILKTSSISQQLNPVSEKDRE